MSFFRVLLPLLINGKPEQILILQSLPPCANHFGVEGGLNQIRSH